MYIYFYIPILLEIKGYPVFTKIRIDSFNRLKIVMASIF